MRKKLPSIELRRGAGTDDIMGVVDGLGRLHVLLHDCDVHIKRDSATTQEVM